ncbi:MAG TPA: hypothetical protein VHV10_02855 [Ktedonobacteraceae bacterium]|jgi:hypothetical protein|nr:hypothetical protein [Ktedonobacteraceae bacterium]
MACQDVANVTGQHLLFLGTETAGWKMNQFTQAAQFAKAHGVDTLILKSADGGNWWYGGMAGYKQRRDVIRGEGVGCIAYTWMYGDTYNFLDGEINILKSFMQEDGAVVADMEVEWNGQAGWARRVTAQLKGYPGLFLVSTWGDPSWQKWQSVLAELNPCVAVYLPQQYNNFLASFWKDFIGASCLQPTLNMTQDVGPNDPVNIAKLAHNQGHTAISIWHYGTAVANPSLLDQIFSAFPKTVSGGQPTMPTTPQGWSDDGTTLKAPDGTPVTLGFRDLVRGSNWDPANVPLETVKHFPILEQSNPGLGAGEAQLFNLDRLEYNPKLGIFPGWLGKELQWYQKQHAILIAQIADLQKQIAALQQGALAQELAALKTKISQAVKDLS